MTNEKLYEVLGDINENHINEARAYHKAKKPGWVKWGAIAACLCLMVPLTAFAIDTIQYNAAVDYLNSLGIPVEDLGDYSHKEIKEAVKTIDAGESSPLTEEILNLPGSRSSITMRPASSVIYLPLDGPTTAPELSVTRKVTPSRGVVVPSMYFSMTRVVEGVLVK